MTTDNKTFCGGSPTWANACVGENGQPSYWEYAKGYSQAANLLIDIVLTDQNSEYSVDEIIYPVCFNMRHSIELRLKGAISELALIEKLRRTQFSFDTNGSHDIGDIWDFFRTKSESIDDRYVAINARLQPMIYDFAQVDPTGQTFRYPTDIASQKHLVEVAIINFVNLKQRFSTLESILDELHQLNDYLCEEYGTKTITNNLSRKKIFLIARMLPHHNQWKDPLFSTKREQIKSVFNIGSNELSASINIIKLHFEFAPLIGISPQLLGLKDQDIIETFRHWLKIHPLAHQDKPKKIVGKNISAHDMIPAWIKDAEDQKVIWQEIEPILTPDILAGLQALFYLDPTYDFSENYSRIYEGHLLENIACLKRSQDEFRANFFHVLEKTNFARKVLKSLYFLKKNDTAEILVATYKLENHFPQLDTARSGAYFKKADYRGC
jgi:hypothetical protein